MKIEVCMGQNCKPYGGQKLADALVKAGVTYEETLCQSLCPHAPVAFVDGKAVLKAKAEDLGITSE